MKSDCCTKYPSFLLVKKYSEYLCLNILFYIQCTKIILGLMLLNLFIVECGNLVPYFFYKLLLIITNNLKLGINQFFIVIFLLFKAEIR